MHVVSVGVLAVDGKREVGGALALDPLQLLHQGLTPGEVLHREVGSRLMARVSRKLFSLNWLPNRKTEAGTCLRSCGSEQSQW